MVDHCMNPEFAGAFYELCDILIMLFIKVHNNDMASWFEDF